MAVGVGWLIGYGSAKLIDWMNSTVARNAFTWVIPFATYVLAEEIHASGVIAIVIAAVELNSRVKVGAEDRLTGHAFWETVEMLFTGVAFGLIGLSVRDAVEEVGAELVHAVVLGVVDLRRAHRSSLRVDVGVLPDQRAQGESWSCPTAVAGSVASDVGRYARIGDAGIGVVYSE